MKENKNEIQERLTEKKGSYVRQLIKNQDKISTAYAQPECTVTYLKTLVKEIICSANNKNLEDKSTATKRFLSHLEKQKTKQDILTLVWNASLKGDNLGVYK